MLMSPSHAEPVAIAVLAQASLAGFARTRHAPGAAAPQARVIERTVEIARAANIGPVTLWAAPEQDHPTIQTLAALFGVALARQPAGDLGTRVMAALTAAHGPVLAIGTGCAALTPAHLRAAADALAGGVDVAIVPVDDGGYALIGMHEPDPRLFVDMPWGTATLMAETRRRLTRLSLSWREPAQLRDVPDDLERPGRGGLASLLG
jgi:glycosyltransferase A (GT-A) superfamily protein (DUF2064 family)